MSSKSAHATERALSKRQDGSGPWLLDSDHFTTWLNAPTETLFCPGVPGAGKTILASVVIDHLWSHIRKDNVGVAYLFCDYKKQEEQTFINLIASILKQLAQQQITISDGIANCYHDHVMQKTYPTINQFCDLLKCGLTKFARTYIVIDALDECSDDYSIRRRLLDTLRELQQSSLINIMVTSRPIPHIVSSFPSGLTQEIRASESDIRRYLDSQMSRLPARVKNNQILQQTIVHGIVAAVDGMYVPSIVLYVHY